MGALPMAEQGFRLSFGSLMHVVKGGNCKVCVFNRKKGGAVCRHGAMCYFCHGEHKPYARPPRYLRGVTGAAATNSGEANPGDDGEDAGAVVPPAANRRRPRRRAKGDAAQTDAPGDDACV